GLHKKIILPLLKLRNMGRTIVLVTLAAANTMLCYRLLFLGRGGRLCYFGPPIQAFEFFQLQGEDFADIYNLLDGEEAVAQNWAKKFRRSPQYQRYVANHLSIGEQLQTTIAPPPPTKRASRWGQFLILSRRYSQLMLRDPVSLSLNLFTAPVGILLIRLAIRDQNPFADQPSLPIASLARQVLFVFTCAALWVGLSSSLQEIVRETVIYQRERLVNLDILSYLGSKLSVLSALAVVQTLLMTLVILISFAWPESNLISWPIGIGVTTWLTLLGCISLGLMVSAMVKNNAQASSALPIILLPQIIFSGILFKMEGLSRVFSWLMLSRWSIGAYGTLADVNQLIPRPVQLPNGTTIAQSIQASAAYEPTWENLVLNWGMLLLHSLCHLGITWGLQKRKDIF
ncbi:MAG: ABC transporter permease, partial [Microcoleaceae cyanobacterium]